MFSIDGLVNNNESHRIEIFCFTTGKTITFPAFLTDFSDSFKLDISSTPVYGRMDPVITYKNTTRNISIAFDVPSVSLNEAYMYMGYIDVLIQSLYPIYTSEGGGGKGTYIISSPPLFRIKFGNLLSNATSVIGGSDRGLLGYIPNFDFKPKVDSGFFVNAATQQLLPKLISVNLAMNVLHEHPLGNVLTEKNELSSRISLPGSNLGMPTFPHQYNSPTSEQLATLNTTQESFEAPADVKEEHAFRAAEEGALGSGG